MRYMSYASGQYVMSIDEAEDISEIRESGVYALEGYAHPVAVHIMKDEDTEETDDGELKNEFCDRNYHLNLEGCS